MKEMFRVTYIKEKYECKKLVGNCCIFFNKDISIINIFKL